MRPDKMKIEPRFKEAIDLWMVYAITPGSFITAVLHNNLRAAIKNGDDAALDNLPHVVAYLYSSAPAACWGSPDRVRRWRGTASPMRVR